jgi:AcrR family transcriptional regulator
MDAALSCFAQSGYDATRIRDIAQTRMWIGVQKGPR